MKSHEQLAADLKRLYSDTFGGKSRGRYKISRDDLKRLAGREQLRADFVFKLMAEAEVEHSIKIIELAGGRYFGVIEEAKMLAWRTVPSRSIT
jgi:hypothetical protein